jgi:hypothetical protein
MYLHDGTTESDAQTTRKLPGRPVPYREAVEQTERKFFDEYTRACAGVRVLQMLRREAMSPAEQVHFWEKVIDWLPKIFEIKRLLEEKVRAGQMSHADADANLSSQMRHVFPPGYALRSLDSELAAARCALSKARWQFMVWQRTGRIPGERRLLHGLSEMSLTFPIAARTRYSHPGQSFGFGEPAVAAGPKADLVFDKFEFGLSLVPAAHKPAIDALADRIVAIARQVPGPLGTVRLVGHTDFIDTEKYNQALGLIRAKVVRGALATALEARLRGVTSRIEIVPDSRGELQPATKDTSPAGRELNRRVEVFLALKFAGTPRQRVPDLRLPPDYDPDRPRPPYRPGPSPIFTTKVLPRKCVKPYEVVVKFLRRLLDEALKRSPIPRRLHARIRELAEKRAADLRDDLIENGLEEMGLEARFRPTARQLIVYAIQQACI